MRAGSSREGGGVCFRCQVDSVGGAAEVMQILFCGLECDCSELVEDCRDQALGVLLV